MAEEERVGAGQRGGNGVGAGGERRGHVAHAKVDVTYRDPSGHTIVAPVHVLDRIELLLVVSHAPPGSDASRASYFTDLLQHIPPRDARHPNRMGVWIGDFNFEERLPDGERVSAAARTRLTSR